MCTNFVDVLAELHAVDPSGAGLDDLGRGAGYVARQVGGWSERYRKAGTDNVGDYERVMALARRAPARRTSAQRVIHNDFRLDNVVLAADDPLRVVGVLDWEMATLGDPLMDLGGALAYWIQADDEASTSGMSPPALAPARHAHPRARWSTTTRARTGHTVTPEQWRFYEVFGLFRLGVIAQQIYYRYHPGRPPTRPTPPSRRGAPTWRGAATG